MHHPTKERGHPQLWRDERSLSRCKFWDSEDEKWEKKGFLNPLALIWSSDFVSQVQRQLSGFVRLFSQLLTISPLLLKISKSMVIRIYLFSNIAEFAPGWKVIDIILTQFAILSKPIIPGKKLVHSIWTFYHKTHEKLLLSTNQYYCLKNVRKVFFFPRNFCVSVFSSERWQAKITWPWREKLQSIDDTCQLDICLCCIGVFVDCKL